MPVHTSPKSVSATYASNGVGGHKHVLACLIQVIMIKSYYVIDLVKI